MTYDTPPWLLAFSTGKEGGVETLGLRLDDLALPRQTHGDRVALVTAPGRPEDTDAVVTAEPGLCVCVKTADCVPVLLYDTRLRRVAAVHAGWRGTAARIAEKALAVMRPQRPGDVSAIIGPSIGPDSFEVGEEVVDRFRAAGYPPERVARRGGKWRVDLWEANRWLLAQCGVGDIRVAGVDTMRSPLYFSARRETIATGRNYNGLMIRP